VAVQQLGDIGSRLDLVMVQGTTFGPVRIQLKQPGGREVDLTGAAVRAAVRRRRGDVPLQPMQVVVHAPPSRGFFSIALTATQTTALGDLEQRRYDPLKLFWDMVLEDAIGAVRPLFWGEVLVHLGGAHG
jgi:hypothetical protein